MKILLFALVFTILQGFIACDWWESANFYQIYPKSFKDSNGDGIGDLRGIIQKLDYFVDLGINAVWLSPIFKSPQKDGGYDISDYRAIDPMFGTMEDFEELVAEGKKRDIHLLLDFVPNHSSDQHEWFQKSEAREEGYEDYYLWHPGRKNGDDRPLPPSNWISVFRGSSWQWSEKRQEYYYHQFVKEQPDVNYRSPSVVKEMKDVLRFWLDKGISGFRVDAIPHLFESDVGPDGNYPDEPLSGFCQPDENCYLNHVHTTNLPETVDMIYQWREVLEEYSNPTRIMMTEAYAPIETVMKYYGNATHNGSHIPFNFEILSGLNNDRSAKHLKQLTENYLNFVPNGQIPNFVLGNHDQKRIATRLGGEAAADLYNMYLQTVPGVAVTYQGEEIVLSDVYVSWEQTQDPQACNTNQSFFDQVSRDPCRTPMQWDDTKNAGFSETDGSTWLPIGDNYRELNVKKQSEDPNSYLNIFKKLVKLHKEDAFKNGLYESSNAIDKDVYAYIRSYKNDAYLILLNFAKEDKKVNVKDAFRSLAQAGRVVVASKNSGLVDNQLIRLYIDVQIKAEAGFIVKLLE